jgi:hypothetical protein
MEKYLGANETFTVKQIHSQHINSIYKYLYLKGSGQLPDSSDPRWKAIQKNYPLLAEYYKKKNHLSDRTRIHFLLPSKNIDVKVEPNEITDELYEEEEYSDVKAEQAKARKKQLQQEEKEQRAKRKKEIEEANLEYRKEKEQKLEVSSEHNNIEPVKLISKTVATPSLPVIELPKADSGAVAIPTKRRPKVLFGGFEEVVDEETGKKVYRQKQLSMAERAPTYTVKQDDYNFVRTPQLKRKMEQARSKASIGMASILRVKTK